MTVTLENTGLETKTYKLEPKDETGKNLMTQPNNTTVEVKPTKRKQVAFNLQAQETGEYIINVEGARNYLQITDYPTATVDGAIKDRNTEKRIEQQFTNFKDGDSNKNERYEDRKIPPVKKQKTQFKTAAKGNIENFGNIVNPDSKDSSTFESSGGELKVGTALSYIPGNNVISLRLKYDSTQPIKLDVVEPNNQTIDTNSNYYLPSGKNTITYQLTPQEKIYIDSQNEILTVETSSTISADIQKEIGLATRNMINKTRTDIQVQNIKTQKTEYKKGEQIEFNVTLTNNGNSTKTKQIKLNRNSNTIETKQIFVNPNKQKHIKFYHTEYNTGDQTFNIDKQENIQITINE